MVCETAADGCHTKRRGFLSSNPAIPTVYLSLRYVMLLFGIRMTTILSDVQNTHKFINGPECVFIM
jgi:hypothetical protein